MKNKKHEQEENIINSLYENSLKNLKDNKKKYYFILIAFITFLLISIICSVSMGAFKVDIKTAYEILIYKIFGIGTQNAEVLTQTPAYNVIWSIRFPRVILGAIVGAGLALCGCVMQACVQNPLAEPYILGISSGASLGATFSIMLGVGAIPFISTSGVAFWSFIGAMIASFMVLKLASINGRASSTKLILSGTVISALCTSASNFIISIASDAQGMQNVKFWTMGSLASAKWESILVPLLVTVGCCIYFLTQTRLLNTMLVGDEAAITLGMNLNKKRKVYMVLTSMLTGILVASCGVIGFVGLIIPHIVRSIVGADHKRLLPICIIAGSIFLVWADAVARIIIPNTEMSIGIITSLIGGPFFAYILIKKSNSFK
nr:iron ABC transporter permease [uncultured Romboutsia sp.]